MSVSHARPSDRFVDEPVETLDAACPACGARALRRYRSLRANGWHRVERCRDCFAFQSCEPIPQSYVPLTAGWPTSSAG